MTAAQLHVHGNTVIYRLHRIEELLGLDLSDPEALVHIKLAFMIENVLGEAQPATTADPAASPTVAVVAVTDRRWDCWFVDGGQREGPDLSGGPNRPVPPRG